MEFAHIGGAAAIMGPLFIAVRHTRFPEQIAGKTGYAVILRDQRLWSPIKLTESFSLETPQPACG